MNVSTRLAYENLKLAGIARHPDIDGMIADIENQDLYGMVSKMENVFEPGIVAKYPVIQEIEDLMEANGALKAVMSGSGPTVFGIFDDAKNGGRCCCAAQEQAGEDCICNGGIQSERRRYE